PPIEHWAPGTTTDLATDAANKLQRLFPGIGEVFHTPAVGYWEGGQLKETASGFLGRQLIGKLLNFDPQRALEQPAQTAG
ncbi:MAG: hypothetical protein K2V38_08665, partial [Gemmataceae bacterium]|nr:hypothetical protein [Gemmataceae bacterium]